MSERTGGDAVVAALAAAGVEVVFGIPSVHNLPIYDALRRDGRIRAVTVRHEQGAAGAADGYARTTGRLGVLITSTGPGAANAMGGLLEAFASSSPVLHLTGQIETRYLDQARGFIHEVPDQPAMLSSLAKAHHRVAATADVHAAVLAGARLAMAGRRGPVSVEIPIDLQYAAAPATGDRAEPPVALAAEEVPTADPGAIDEAVAQLRAARRPLIWAGGGAVAADAADEVAELVRRTGAGLLTSPNGRGIVDEDDPACIGNLPWDPGVRELAARADLLVAVGTRFQGPNTENWKMALPARLVHVDVDASVPGRSYPATPPVIGDAKATLRAMLQALGDGAPNAARDWAAEVAAARTGARTRLRDTLGPQVGLLDELAACLPPGTVVVKDSTIPAYTWGNRLLRVDRPRTSIMPNGFAIGLGLPQALGAAAGASAPVVLLAGDGGFLLAATELATAASEGLPVVSIVFVDGGYGILRNIQDRQFGEVAGRIGVELGRPDFVGLARSLGVEGERVDDLAGYSSALRTALAAGAPRLVEVDLDAIGPMRVPYTGTSRPPESR